MKLSDYRAWLRGRLRTLRSGQAALVEEYIQEAESQDGERYWDQFVSDADVVADFDIFALYAQEADDDSE